MESVEQILKAVILHFGVVGTLVPQELDTPGMVTIILGVVLVMGPLMNLVNPSLLVVWVVRQDLKGEMEVLGGVAPPVLQVVVAVDIPVVVQVETQTLH